MQDDQDYFFSIADVKVCFYLFRSKGQHFWIQSLIKKNK
jgi:hypothetical protein